MTAEQLMGERKIEDTEHSQEINYDKKFISRWTDRCVEIKRQYGQQKANEFAKQLFSRDIIRLINAEIERRKIGGKR